MNITILERRNARNAGNDVDVDPRIAARRASVRDARLRRWRRLGLGVLAVAVAIAGAWLLSRTPLFDVDRIRVEGASALGVDDVVAASGVRIGEPLLSVDTGAAARRLEQQPQILSAKVTRDINGLVSIHVVERVAVGWTDAGEGVRMLVDVTGAELGEAGPDDPSLPQVIGTDAGPLELASILPPGVRSRTLSVEAVDGLLRLHLRPAGTVEFGPPTALPAKVAALVTVMGQVDQRDLCTIRVITPDTPVVTRTPICG